MTQSYYGEILRNTYRDNQINHQSIYQTTQKLLTEQKNKCITGITFQDAEYKRKSLYYLIKQAPAKEVQELYRKYKRTASKVINSNEDKDLEEFMVYLFTKAGKHVESSKIHAEVLNKKYYGWDKHKLAHELKDIINSIDQSKEYLQKHAETIISEYGNGYGSMHVKELMDLQKQYVTEWSDEELENKELIMLVEQNEMNQLKADQMKEQSAKAEYIPPPMPKEEIKTNERIPKEEIKSNAKIPKEDIKATEKALTEIAKPSNVDNGCINIFKQIITSKITLDSYDLETKSLLLHNLLQLLVSGKNADDIQGELLDILGVDNFDGISELLLKRDYISKQYQSVLESAQAKSKKQVSNIGGLTEISRIMIFDDSLGITVKPKKVIVEAEYKTYTATSCAQTIFKRKDEADKEIQSFEIKGKPDLSEYKLIEISSLPEWVQDCFAGLNTLNPVQSICFNVAFNTTKNMLVCAPTSSGKTNVALLTMLKEMSYYDPSTGLKAKPFKIVYVSPMKALAAELVDKFSCALKHLGVEVRELTGDMNLSKKELDMAQILVVTPEKLDVITRKTNSIMIDIGLLILDEIHLLHEKRGSVLECLIVRALNSIQKNQKALRIVSLSATLPNFNDVAEFVHASPDCTFHFDYNFRPTMLTQNFYGIKEANLMKQKEIMLKTAFKICTDVLKKEKQVLIFVHSRKDTYNTGMEFIDMLKENPNFTKLFQCDNSKSQSKYVYNNSRNKNVQVLYPYGIGIHHAGMLRADRSLMEKCFKEGCIKVLICTSTLAWGVNLPAYEVIIMGTEYYNPETSRYEDIGILDLLQIFGRAGRPQYEEHGEASIITTQSKMYDFIRLLTHQTDIESNLLSNLYDVFNAEISMGTISNIREAIQFLRNTYLARRITKNPLKYGLKEADLAKNPGMYDIYAKIANEYCEKLAESGLIEMNKAKETLGPKDIGKISSAYYLDYKTAKKFMKHCSEMDTLDLFSRAKEFKQMKIRNEETKEINELKKGSQFAAFIEGRDMQSSTKVLLLLECYICGIEPQEFSLISDTNYIIQNAVRILRGLFEICLYLKTCQGSIEALKWSILVGKRMNLGDHVLYQFTKSANHTLLSGNKYSNGGYLREETVSNLVNNRINLRKLYDKETRSDLLSFLNQSNINELYGYVAVLPLIMHSIIVLPVSSAILKIVVQIQTKIEWKDRWNGLNENFWVICEINDIINHKELVSLSKDRFKFYHSSYIEVSFFLPFTSAGVLNVNIVSERWFGVDFVQSYDMSTVTKPKDENPMTDFITKEYKLITDLKNDKFQILYSHIPSFNAVQSNVFNTIYNTDENVLVGAPTGSGKTYIAELAIIRMLTNLPNAKAVYIAPLKALTQERYYDWKQRFDEIINIRVEELTGDINPDRNKIEKSQIIITTPEKWDGVTRQWQERDYVKKVVLIIIDEVHLLGTDRGGVLEAILVRIKYMKKALGISIRLVALSTALSNGKDVARWLEVGEKGYFNFRQDVRPVPLNKEIIGGFSDPHYCPRMRTMNKPAYNKIMELSPNNPVIIFVSSRRQTRLTAMDMINFSTEQFEMHKVFLHMPMEELEVLMTEIEDEVLRHTLLYGIGVHHAGLVNSDRRIVEDLYLNKKIQIMIATSTLAWGVNFPARMVIIKGTEYFDPKTKRYVDYSLTDIIQMMGRAGRPQFDDRGEAVLLTDDSKAEFYRSFLNTPLPVESFLLPHLTDHINSEIVSGVIANVKGIENYIKDTYFWIRVFKNPGYYNLKENPEDYIKHLSFDIYKSLSEAKMVEKNDDVVSSSQVGIIASNYYISYMTVDSFSKCQSESIEHLLYTIAKAVEFNDLPVRHLEDKIIEEMNKYIQYPLDNVMAFNSPNTKGYILLHYHLSHIPFPIEDFRADTFLLLNQVMRVINAFVEYCIYYTNYNYVCNLMNISQMIICKQWINCSPFLYLIDDPTKISFFANENINYIPELVKNGKALMKSTSDPTILKAISNAMKLPSLKINYAICGVDSQSLKPSQTAKLDKNEEASLHMHITNSNPESIDILENKGRKDTWLIMLVDDNSQKVVKHVKIGNAAKIYRSVLFVLPLQPSECKLKLIVMNDTFIGIDMVIPIDMKRAIANVDIIDYNKEV